MIPAPPALLQGEISPVERSRGSLRLLTSHRQAQLAAGQTDEAGLHDERLEGSVVLATVSVKVGASLPCPGAGMLHILPEIS